MRKSVTTNYIILIFLVSQPVLQLVPEQMEKCSVPYDKRKKFIFVCSANTQGACINMMIALTLLPARRRAFEGGAQAEREEEAADQRKEGQIGTATPPRTLPQVYLGQGC